MGTTGRSVPRPWGYFDRQLAEDQQIRSEQLRQRVLVPTFPQTLDDEERRLHEDVGQLSDAMLDAEVVLLTIRLSEITFHRLREDASWIKERIERLRREQASRRRKGLAA